MAAAGAFEFGHYRVELFTKQLLRNGVHVELSERQFNILHALVSSPGAVVPKEMLIAIGWKDTAVGDSSLEKIIFQLRQALDADNPHRYIKTVARRGYQFVAPVTRLDSSEVAGTLDVMLAPHRTWIEALAAVETFAIAQFPKARSAFERLLEQDPGRVECLVGLANVAAMQFEATRTDAEPDTEALGLALLSAERACSLRPEYDEAWAALGFILERSDRRDDAQAALDRAVRLAPDNSRHHVRLAAANWGEVRLRAAQRALVLYPDLPLARVLAASVHTARNALPPAEREIDAGIATASAEAQVNAPLPATALHWFKGLFELARGERVRAMASFDRELALEPRGLLYSRECAANTWYAKGACYLGEGNHTEARVAFGETLKRVPRHPKALVMMAMLDGHLDLAALQAMAANSGAVAAIPAAALVDVAMAAAACAVLFGDVTTAVTLLLRALNAAPPGNSGWLIPIEPLLGVALNREAWTPVLAVLHVRAR